ncbi:MAG: hypothetical protein M1837_004293 [Sclerophora amabilis]|nr:MAG: hypothetical protein M1837_004293 [Sclerophora amabilis]
MRLLSLSASLLALLLVAHSAIIRSRTPVDVVDHEQIRRGVSPGLIDRRTVDTVWRYSTPQQWRMPANDPDSVWHHLNPSNRRMLADAAAAHVMTLNLSLESFTERILMPRLVYSNAPHERWYIEIDYVNGASKMGPGWRSEAPSLADRMTTQEPEGEPGKWRSQDSPAKPLGRWIHRAVSRGDTQGMALHLKTESKITFEVRTAFDDDPHRRAKPPPIWSVDETLKIEDEAVNEAGDETIEESDGTDHEAGSGRRSDSDDKIEDHEGDEEGETADHEALLEFESSRSLDLSHRQVVRDTQPPPYGQVSWYIKPRDKLLPADDRDLFRPYLNPASREIMAKAAASCIENLDLTAKDPVKRIFIPNIWPPSKPVLERVYLQIYWSYEKEQGSELTSHSDDIDLASKNNATLEPSRDAAGEWIQGSPVVTLGQWIYKAVSKGDSMGKVVGRKESWHEVPPPTIEFRMRSLNPSGNIGPDLPPPWPSADWVYAPETLLRSFDDTDLQWIFFLRRNMWLPEDLRRVSRHNLDAGRSERLGSAAAEFVMQLDFSRESFTERIYLPEKADPQTPKTQRWYIQIDFAKRTASHGLPPIYRPSTNRWATETIVDIEGISLADPPVISLGQWIHRAVTRGDSIGTARTWFYSDSITFRVLSSHAEPTLRSRSASETEVDADEQRTEIEARADEEAGPRRRSDSEDSMNDHDDDDQEDEDGILHHGESPDTTSCSENPDLSRRQAPPLLKEVRPRKEVAWYVTPQQLVLPSRDRDVVHYYLNRVSRTIMAEAAAKHVMSLNLSSLTFTERLYIPDGTNPQSRTLERWYVEIKYIYDSNEEPWFRPVGNHRVTAKPRKIELPAVNEDGTPASRKDVWYDDSAPIITLGQWIYKAIMKGDSKGNASARDEFIAIEFHIRSLQRDGGIRPLSPSAHEPIEAAHWFSVPPKYHPDKPSVDDSRLNPPLHPDHADKLGAEAAKFVMSFDFARQDFWKSIYVPATSHPQYFEIGSAKVVITWRPALGGRSRQLNRRVTERVQHFDGFTLSTSAPIFTLGEWIYRAVTHNDSEASSISSGRRIDTGDLTTQNRGEEPDGADNADEAGLEPRSPRFNKLMDPEDDEALFHGRMPDTTSSGHIELSRRQVGDPSQSLRTTKEYIVGWFITPRRFLLPTNDRDLVRYQLHPLSRTLIANWAADYIMRLNFSRESFNESAYIPHVPSLLDPHAEKRLEKWYIQIIWTNNCAPSSACDELLPANRQLAVNPARLEPANSLHTSYEASWHDGESPVVLTLGQWIQQALERGESMGKVETGSPSRTFEFRVRFLQCDGQKFLPPVPRVQEPSWYCVPEPLLQPASEEINNTPYFYSLRGVPLLSPPPNHHKEDPESKGDWAAPPEFTTEIQWHMEIVWMNKRSRSREDADNDRLATDLPAPDRCPTPPVHDAPVITLGRWIERAVLAGDRMGMAIHVSSQKRITFRIDKWYVVDPNAPPVSGYRQTGSPPGPLMAWLSTDGPEIYREKFRLDDTSAESMGTAAADHVMTLSFYRKSFSERFYIPNEPDPRSPNGELWYIEIDWRAPSDRDVDSNRLVFDRQIFEAASLAAARIPDTIRTRTLGTWIFEAVQHRNATGKVEWYNGAMSIEYRVGPTRVSVEESKGLRFVRLKAAGSSPYSRPRLKTKNYEYDIPTANEAGHSQFGPFDSDDEADQAEWSSFDSDDYF